MLVLSSKDIFIVRHPSLIADYDIETLFNLYQPLVGSVACSLYSTLLYEEKNQKIFNFETHEDLLVKMQLNTKEFLKARGNLEAVGLLRTFVEDGANDIKIYHYDLYAPKTPRAFFEDVLLYGLLIRYIGETNAKRLNAIYNEKEREKNGVEISQTFGSVFHPDLNDDIYLKAINSGKNKGRRTAKIDFEFNYDTFFEALKAVSQISKTALTNQEMKEVVRLASLYGVNEVTSANVVASIYNSEKEKGKRLDFKKMLKLLNDEANYRFLTYEDKKSLKTKITSDTDMARKIELLESKSPVRYLSYLQNNRPVASSDVNILNDVSRKYGLRPSVINVLIDYVLTNNNNILSRPYMEKVAASLVREGVETTLGAMDYFNKGNENKDAQFNKNGDNGNGNKPQQKETPQEEDISWEELMRQIKGGNDND